MSGLIPQAFIDEIITRTDVVDLIDSYVPLKKQGTSFVARCPFHSEKTPSFNVIPKKQFYHCFGCGMSGNAISFMMDYLHQDFVTSIETLAARLGLEIPKDASAVTPTVSKSHYQLLAKVAQYYQQQLSQSPLAIEYLKQRGVSGQAAKTYQIGFAPPGWHSLEHAFKQDKKGLILTGMLIEKDLNNHYDRYRNRIVYPIHDRRGRIIGFGGRVIDPNDKPKYLNSPETPLFQKGRELYGLYLATQHNKQLDYLLIVEGYMDVIALAEHGLTTAVATLGTATSPAHIQLMAKHSKQLFFCFDGDTAGKQAAWRALESSLGQLSEGLDVRFVFLPEGHDPDSLIREIGLANFSSYLTQATPLNQFFFSHLLESINISTMAGKTQLINKAMSYLSKLPPGPYLDLMSQQLARHTHVSEDRLQNMIQGPTAKVAHSMTQSKTVPSNLRLIITLLLQNPELYPSQETQLKALILNSANHQILGKLIEQLQQNPHLSTAGLVEQWRNHPSHSAIQKLASWQHHVPQSGLEEELSGALQRLNLQCLTQSIDALLQQAKQRPLNISEQKQLQDLIKQRLNISQHEKTLD